MGKELQKKAKSVDRKKKPKEAGRGKPGGSGIGLGKKVTSRGVLKKSRLIGTRNKLVNH